MDLLFLGDSITEFWSKAPVIWQSYFGSYRPANFGISGDKTQNVIWRIEHGELDAIHPKVVVLMLGTNNTSTCTASQIFKADRRIVSEIQKRLPATKVLLLAIFPCGPTIGKNGQSNFSANEKKMAIIRETNRLLSTLEDGERVRFLDIGSKFYNGNGRIPPEVMPDQLHPSPAGYQIWADAMKPLLVEMINTQSVRR